MSLKEELEKLAGESGEIDTTEKIASYYDGLGRGLFWEMVENGLEKAAKRKLPPGAFSGKKGVMKLLGLGGLGAGSYAVGASREKKRGAKDDVEIANRAYQAGVRRGAQAVLAKLRGMG